MHGKRFIFSQLQFGSDGEKLYLRIDFVPDSEDILKSGELRVTVRVKGDEQRTAIRLANPKEPVSLVPNGEAVLWAANAILEVAIPVIKGREFGPVDVCLSIWKDGLPIDAVPQQGWLTIAAESTWSS